MLEPKIVINKEMYNELVVKMTEDDLNEFVEVLISVNPVYEWLEENINIVGYKLLKGFITNIVPLGNAGRKYFESIVKKKAGFTDELMDLYNRLEITHLEGSLKIISYLKLIHMGYTGIVLGGKCPVDDITKYLKEHM